MVKVLVFGTFDGVHEGHRAMLRQAKALGTYLIVAVAPDHIVEKIKGAVPRKNSAQRIETLKGERLADEIVLGDENLHAWDIVKRCKPQVIALGYDQDELRQALEAHLDEAYPEVETASGEFEKHPKRPTIVVLDPHHPERYKSSLLNQ